MSRITISKHTTNTQTIRKEYKVPIFFWQQIYYWYSVIDRLTGYIMTKARFFKHVGYCPNARNPVSFNEKILWKKIHDRNPLLSTTSDKYTVRSYVQDMLGDTTARRILVPLLHVTTRPEDIPFNELPKEYVVKVNNRSGCNILVTRTFKPSKKDIIHTCKDLLRQSYGYHQHEWGYQDIPPKIIIEKLLRDEQGNIPKDYKFYIFHGKCRFVHVDFDRFKEPSRSLFTRDWKFLPAPHTFPRGPKIAQPATYSYMLSIAEKLGRHFDFVRVDLYTTDSRVYFGELTHYPGAGMARFTPSFDFELGKYWNIEEKYWEKV